MRQRDSKEAAHKEIEAVIPVIEERIDVDKREVETGRVRVTKKVVEEEHTVSDASFSEEVQVERVPINRPVDSAPEIRVEGDTTIIPVLEEEVVVQKRTVLKEEVRITRVRGKGQPQKVKTRREEVQIERVPGGTEGRPTGS